MSKAFTKEDTELDDDLPDEPAPLPAGAKNYMTPAGFRGMQRQHVNDGRVPGKKLEALRFQKIKHARDFVWCQMMHGKQSSGLRFRLYQ